MTVALEEKYDQVRQLIAMGKERGYLLYDEVNDILPPEVHSSEEIDDLLSTFERYGIDVYEDQPGLRRGKLGDHPFGIVRRPHADAVAAFEPEHQQAGGERVDPFLQLTVGPADLLVPDDQRIALAKALDDPVEMDTDRIADKGRVARAVDVAQPHHLQADTSVLDPRDPV